MTIKRKAVVSAVKAFTAALAALVPMLTLSGSGMPGFSIACAGRAKNKIQAAEMLAEIVNKFFMFSLHNGHFFRIRQAAGIAVINNEPLAVVILYFFPGFALSAFGIIGEASPGPDVAMVIYPVSHVSGSRKLTR